VDDLLLSAVCAVAQSMIKHCVSTNRLNEGSLLAAIRARAA
jgi:hypothetical protein